jgi:DNA-binding transcriptional MerR regulator
MASPGPKRGVSARLAPVDRDALWNRLALTKAQVARLAGVSRRQMIYWSSKGLLGDPGRRTFDGRAVEKVTLIKSALDQGHTLSIAAELAEKELRPRR